MPMWFYSDGGVTRTFLDHQETTANASTFDFTGLSFGVASSGRYLVACIGWGRQSSSVASVLSSAIIGGVAATIVAQSADSSGSMNTAICIALVPTGTSGSVSATWTGAAGFTEVALYSLSGNSSATPTTATSSVALSPTATINVPDGGAVIGIARGGGTTPTATWSNLNEDVDTQTGVGNSLCFSSASAQFVSSQTSLIVQCTFSSVTVAGGCFAVWGP